MDDGFILQDVKELFGIEADTTAFDGVIRSYINSALFTLNQLGVGPTEPFSIDTTTTWAEFESQIPKDMLLNYLYLKTKLIFDPPTSGALTDVYNNRISELEFRMSIVVDNGNGVIVG